MKTKRPQSEQSMEIPSGLEWNTELDKDAFDHHSCLTSNFYAEVIFRNAKLEEKEEGFHIGGP